MKIFPGVSKCVIGKIYDINKDGHIDISDVIKLQRIALKLDPIPTDLSTYPVCYDARLDYNNDKKIDVGDMILLTSVAISSTKCVAGKVYDINGDGQKDISDVILLLRITFGLDIVSDVNGYPVCAG